MGQWYCHTGGQQYGPIEESVLRQWIAEGRVGSSDKVWSPGMVEWVAVGRVGGLLPYGTRPHAFRATGAHPTLGPQSGTGGRRGVGELLSGAWELMRDRWGIAIGFAVLWWLLLMGVGIASGIPRMILQMLGGLLGAVTESIAVMIVLTGVGVIISTAIQWILTAPFELGADIFFLSYVRRGHVDIGMLFAGWRNFRRAARVYMLRIGLTVFWMLVAALPGALAGLLVFYSTGEEELALGVGAVAAGVPYLIVTIYVSLRYALVIYVLADNPSMTTHEVFRCAIEMMKGRKLRLFGLYLIMGLIALGLFIVVCVGWVALLVFFLPYSMALSAFFYEDLLPPPNVAGGTGIAPVAGPLNPYGG